MGNTCMRRAPEIKNLIESKNLNPESITSDEEMQKLMNEIILEEFENNPNKDPDSDFVKEICEFKNSKITLLRKNNENQEKLIEEKKLVALMMRDIMNRVMETQKF